MKNVSLIKMKKIRLNFKPNSIVDLQKIKSLPEVIAILSPIASRKRIILELIFASQVINALTKLINHNDLHNVDNSDAFIVSKNLKKMKLKPHSSISNNFSKIFGLMIFIINRWSKNFVWPDWIFVNVKAAVNYHRIVPPEVPS